LSSVTSSRQRVTASSRQRLKPDPLDVTITVYSPFESSCDSSPFFSLGLP